MNFLKAKAVILLLALLAVFTILASIFLYQPTKRPVAVDKVVAAAAPAAVKICPADFKRNLQLGMRGADVKELQKYLNNNGFVLAKTGFGSRGKETTFFGVLTKKALSAFQVTKNIPAAYGVFDEATRIYLGCLKVPLPSEESIEPVGELPTENNNLKYYTVGGEITGISGMIVLQNNGGDDLTISPGANSTFIFPTALADGQTYQITVKTKPANQVCYTHNVAGTISGTSINNIKITCAVGLPYNPFTTAPLGGGAISYALTYTAGANGSLSGTASQTVNSGANGSAVTAVAAAHYYFVNWSDGSTANPRTDTNITADKSVTANFAINTYTITSSAEGGGTISPLGDTIKNYGSSQTYTITPDEFFTILDVSVDSQSVGAVASYEFTGIQANHTIGVTFDGGAQ